VQQEPGNEVKNKHDKHEKNRFTFKNLPCLLQAFYLAEKVGESMGRSKVLQR
jgi:hypothetical protein